MVSCPFQQQLVVVQKVIKFFYQRLYTYTTDLTGQSYGGNIPATAVYVEGGEIAAYNAFAGDGIANSQYLIGTNVDYRSPGPSGTTNNTGNGLVGNDHGVVALSYQVDIPLVSEDTYVGTATYVIGHN